jgi:hypothetical protein
MPTVHTLYASTHGRVLATLFFANREGDYLQV